MRITKGDFVRVRGNAPGTVWEIGRVEHLQDGQALLSYGSRDLPDWMRLRGLREPVPVERLAPVERGGE